MSDERIRQIVETAERYADAQVGYDELHSAQGQTYTLLNEFRITPASPRNVCVLTNAAVAANWLTATDVHYQREDLGNSACPSDSFAAGYIAWAATDAVFYATYDGPDAVDVVMRRNVEGALTPFESIWQKCVRE